MRPDKRFHSRRINFLEDATSCHLDRRERSCGEKSVAKIPPNVGMTTSEGVLGTAQTIPALAVALIVAMLASSIPAGAQFVFGPPVDPSELFEELPLGAVSAPTVRDDQLELFYSTFGDIWRATRTTTANKFSDPRRVTSISTVEYVEESPFLSADGLRVYFARRLAQGSNRSEVMCASRPNLNAPFGVPVALGPDGTNRFVGKLGSLSVDELVVYLEVIRDPKGLSNQTDIAFSTRASAGDRFDGWTYIDSVNTSGQESRPTLSRDGFNLFFSRASQGAPGIIFSSGRDSLEEPFQAPHGVQGVNVSGTSAQDPFLLSNGARLYFVQDDLLVYSNRVLSGAYALEPVTALRGQDFQIPIYVHTSEQDIRVFTFTFFMLNPNAFTFLGVVPNERLGVRSFSATFPIPALLRIDYESATPLKGTGENEEVARLKFHALETATLGTRQYSLSGQGSLNGVSVPGTPSSQIQTQDPTVPARGLLRLR